MRLLLAGYVVAGAVRGLLGEVQTALLSHRSDVALTFDGELHPAVALLDIVQISLEHRPALVEYHDIPAELLYC